MCDSRQCPTADVFATVPKRQSISNCWTYAMGTLAEALHNHATHEALDLSRASRRRAVILPPDVWDDGPVQPSGAAPPF